MVIPDDIAQALVLLENGKTKTLAVITRDRYFDIPALAIYSNLGASTIRAHLKKGLPHFKVKGKILIRKSEFDAWLEKYRVNRQQDLSQLVDEVVTQLRTKKQNKAKSA